MKCPKCAFENPPENTRFCGRCGTQFDSTGDPSLSFTRTLETPIETLARGSIFADRYEILEILGTGGMGEVYRVVDKKLEEEVALKLLRPEIASDTKTKERFRNEIKIARKIGHRNVCRMFDFNEEDGKPYITMEYVPGEDLKGLIRRTGQLAIGTSISIAKQVCEGLKEAHRLGVVHRDLKPQNIMIDKLGEAKIMDFGIARSLESQGVTREGVIIGTPEYMSPEQVEGKPADHRADIYSLGVILYELVTGKTPFEGETALSIVHKHKYEEPLPPIKLNPTISGDLNDLILTCMAKDRENRYQDAEMLLSDLVRLESGFPTSERAPQKLKAFTSKDITVQFKLKKILIPALMVVMLAVAAIIFLPKLFQEEPVANPSDRPSLAVLYFKNNTGDQELDHWRDGLADMLTEDLSQSKYLKVLSRNKVYNILENLDLLDAEEYSSEDLAKVASLASVNHILTGNYVKAGRGWRISVSIQQVATGDQLGVETARGEEDTLLSMVDELTMRVKPYFNLSDSEISNDIDENVGSITTQDTKALQLFLEGEKYRRQGNTAKTIEYMEKAIEKDPDFAMAYRAAAGRYQAINNFKKFGEYKRKAFELRNKLSLRERLLLEAENANTYTESIEKYEGLLDLYPDDIEAQHVFANYLRNREEFERAAEIFAKLIRERVEIVFPYGNGAMNYCQMGEYEKAKDARLVWNQYFDGKYWLADILITQGEYELAQKEIENHNFKNDSYYTDSVRKPMLLGDIHHLNGRWAEAEGEYRKIFNVEDRIQHLGAIERLWDLYFAMGCFDKARTQLHEGIELASKLEQRRTKMIYQQLSAITSWFSGKYLQALNEMKDSGSLSPWAEALLMLKLNSFDRTEQILSEMEKEIEVNPLRRNRLNYHQIKGLLHLAKSEFQGARENLEKAVSLMPSQMWQSDRYYFWGQAWQIDDLASAYLQSGDLSKAEPQYLKITTLTTGRLYTGPIYVKAFYNLGKIYQQKDWKGKATENYKRFVKLWKDCDPQLQPLVEDARGQLATLQGIEN